MICDNLHSFPDAKVLTAAGVSSKLNELSMERSKVMLVRYGARTTGTRPCGYPKHTIMIAKIETYS